jgi:hypothetical protein
MFAEINKYINIYAFLGAFIIGIIYIMISAPKPQTIYMYPTLQNAGKITYIDDKNVCYRYEAQEIICPRKK